LSAGAARATLYKRRPQEAPRPMRAEIQQIADEIKQSLELLRRYL
jgi:hypothetical protein